MERIANQVPGAAPDDILTIVTLDERGAYATQDGMNETRNFLIANDPAMADKITVVVGGASANDPAYLAAVLESAVHAQIVVNRDRYGSFVDPAAHEEIIKLLLDAPEGATSWSVLDALLREDEKSGGA